jgi:hypothetical protein
MKIELNLSLLSYNYSHMQLHCTPNFRYLLCCFNWQLPILMLIYSMAFRRITTELNHIFLTLCMRKALYAQFLASLILFQPTAPNFRTHPLDGVPSHNNRIKSYLSYFVHAQGIVRPISDIVDIVSTDSS